MDREEVAAWLRLLETPVVGREYARRLLAAFGSPEAALSAPTAARREVVPAEPAKALENEPDHFPTLLQATWRWLADDSTGPRHLLSLGDPAYPKLLLQTADPPLLLYV